MKLAILLILLTFAFDAAVIGRAFAGETSAAKTKTTPEVYAGKCASCHGKDGRAQTFKAKFNHARNFTDAAWQNDVSDERMFNSISNGKGKMPAYGKKLSQPEIESLITYVRHFKK